MLKIDVEHTDKNEGFYIYLYPFGKPISKKLLYVHQIKKFFEKKINWKLTMN
jgi:hypothetical protein